MANKHLLLGNRNILQSYNFYKVSLVISLSFILICFNPVAPRHATDESDVLLSTEAARLQQPTRDGRAATLRDTSL